MKNNTAKKTAKRTHGMHMDSTSGGNNLLDPGQHPQLAGNKSENQFDESMFDGEGTALVHMKDTLKRQESSGDDINYDSASASTQNKNRFQFQMGSKRSQSKNLLGNLIFSGRVQKHQPALGDLVDPGIGFKYKHKLQNDEFPETALNTNDLNKKLRFDQLKKTKLEEMCAWKQKDHKGIKKTTYIKEVQRKNEKILSVSEKDELEKLEVYTDRFPLLDLRKQLNKIRIIIHLLCKQIMNHKLFGNAVITLIGFNSLSMMMQDPNGEQTPFFAALENIFLALYTVEMVIKIAGMGFVFDEGSYLREAWNILDFTIVMSSYPTLFISSEQDDSGEGGGLNLSGLRAFRVMRPLRSISSIKGLRLLMTALFKAAPLLMDTLIILGFFFSIYAIAGTNLFSGVLKKRCIEIQTGRIADYSELPLCGGSDVCPSGYLCGKTNENPNYGASNFDNVCYGFLAVFQTTTLEGWSDLQRYIQQAYNYNVWVYFVSLVFLGAFFFLNLTLAVINSEFTKANNEQAEAEANEMKEKKNKKFGDQEMENAMSKKDEMSIAQFITARIYAKKMIEFLRIRQAQKKKKIEQLNRNKDLRKNQAVQKRQPQGIGKTTNPKSTKQAKRTDVILEDVAEHVEEPSDQEQLEKDIREFLKMSRSNMKKQMHQGKVLQKSEQFEQREKEGGVPTMKGNIGPSSKFIIDINNQKALQKKQMYQRLANDFAIENVIPDREMTVDLDDNPDGSHRSYLLSNHEHDFDSEYQSQHNKSVIERGTNVLEIPGVSNIGDDDSGLVTSDSNMEKGAKNGIENPFNWKKKRDIKKDVTKTFKKLLTQNHKRSNEYKGRTDNQSESTKFGGSLKEKETFTLNNDIEMKFQRKKQAPFQKNKQYLEDKDIDGDLDDFLRKDKDHVKPVFKSSQEKPANTFAGEYVSKLRPKDPFKDLDPLTQKVDISKGVEYFGTSTNDVFQLRLINREQQMPLEENKFLQLPEHKIIAPDPDFVNKKGCLKPEFNPYQGKVVYDIQQESQSDGSDLVEDNEDLKLAEEQPYITTAMIAYYQMLKQLPTEEVAKRSDIMITSTLSLSMYARDNREITKKNRATLRPREIKEYIDEKYLFNAFCYEYTDQNKQPRNKDKQFSDAYTTSFFANKDFQSPALKQFKEKVQILNSFKKIVHQLDKKTQDQQKIKHAQLKRAVQKKGIPRWDREMAQKLLRGNFHDVEDDEEENDVVVNPESKESVFQKFKEEQNTNNQIEKIDKAVDILATYEHRRIRARDEIPSELRSELNLPEKMGLFEVNLEMIKKQDFNQKRQRPTWSGHDVLQTRLDKMKSEYIVKHINAIRTWPLGVHGLWKRIRFQMRKLVRASFFDSLMTFAVLLNTVVLSFDHYGIEDSMKSLMETFNGYFTWIFIVEMSCKILAIGPNKYLAEKMNWIDGFVVMLSIFEMILAAALAGQGLSLDAFKTVRMFRTFRVFRIARLLKSMQSMRIIINVMIRSYKSFIYITMLMFLFIFIFALLGMQTFGGTMNYPDGKPRGNYDDFPLAFITAFQILTMENWQATLFDTMRSENNKYIVAIYYISWIFMGNFILLNLFLAILLDSFIEDGEEDADEEELAKIKEEKLKKKILKKKQKKGDTKLNMDLKSPKLAEYEKEKLRREREARRIKKLMFATFQHDDLEEEKLEEEENEDLEDLDEEQVVKIYQEQGVLIKSEEQVEKEKMVKYYKIKCEQSLYLLDLHSCIRRVCYRAHVSKFWEPAVQVLIALSSMKLAADTYIADLNIPKIDDISEYIDTAFNFAFIFEMTVKIIVYGLIMDEGSYLRDSWNKLDFFIVSTSIIDMSAQGVEIPIVRLLRMLRVLRPLRFINHNRDLKMIVIALMDSMGHIANVVMVILVVYLIFAIVGVSFFGGCLFYCNIDMYKITNEQDCLFMLGAWEVYDFNFDNVISGMNTLYVVASMEGWPDIMYETLDVTGKDRGPTKDNSLISMIYFVVFILVGSFFFMNFFVGVLFMKFAQAQKNESKGYTREDLIWQDIQKLIVEAKPEYESTNIPTQAWRKTFHNFVLNQKFQQFITLAIVLNMLQMAMAFETANENFKNVLDNSNYGFTITFLGEAICKLIAFGWTYFDNAWNKFDFFVVSSSIFEIILQILSQSIQELQNFNALPQIFRLMRVLRVTRVLRLASKAPGLQAILQTVSFSVTPLMNVVLLLMLIYLMFSILGNFLFKDIGDGEVISSIVNFKTFDSAFFLLIAVSTGESWPIYMMDCSRTPSEDCIAGVTCGVPPWSYVYFYTMVLVISYVMLNLFVLVIIEQFNKYYLPKENTISKFQNDFIVFMETWKIFTQDKFRCKKIKEKFLMEFFRKLGEKGDINTSLGFPKDHYDNGEVNKQLLKMAIKSDNGCVYFNEMLYRCMRRRYGNMKISKRMQIYELNTQFKIYMLTLKEKNQSTKIQNNDIMQNIVKKGNGVNPFLTVMNFRVTFRTWLKIAKKRIMQGKAWEGPIDEVESDSMEENKKQYQVNIEVDYFYEVTSEEDENEKKSSKAGGTDFLSELFSNGLRKAMSSKKSEEKKSKPNYMKNFEKSIVERYQKHANELQARSMMQKASERISNQKNKGKASNAKQPQKQQNSMKLGKSSPQKK